MMINGDNMVINGDNMVIYPLVGGLQHVLLLPSVNNGRRATAKQCRTYCGLRACVSVCVVVRL